MNIINLMLEASQVVQLVLLILLFFSVFSWAIIFYKRRTIRAAFSQSEAFLRAFRKSKNLSEVNEAARRFQGSPLVSLFQAGFKELTHLSKSNPQSPPSTSRLETLSRVLTKASNADAFLKIGIVRSASITTVAPGIAEALIATAVGLFAAIPAVIAYNHFLHRIKDLITEMEDFTLEFLNIADRLYGT
jgi:biopolymer transport protein TolQ